MTPDETPPDRVLAVTQPLTATTVEQVAADVATAASGEHVTVDLTDIPSFDSDGAGLIADLVQRLGPERVSIVGLGQAAARLTGAGELDQPPADPMVVTRLHRTMVVRARPGAALRGRELTQALTRASDAAIVVVDLLGAAVHPSAIASLLYASSEAAVAGRELLVVNVSPEDAERLRRSGLSATTYVAPAPLLG